VVFDRLLTWPWPFFNSCTRFEDPRLIRSWVISYDISHWLPHFAIFHFQNGGHLPSRIFKILKFIGWWVHRAKLHHHVKFHQNCSIYCRDIAICRFLKMPTIRYIGFLKFDFCQDHKVWEANVRQQTKFLQNWPNGFWNITIFLTFKIAAVCRIGF